MEYYTFVVRGDFSNPCGHKHKTLEAAQRCVAKAERTLTGGSYFPGKIMRFVPKRLVVLQRVHAGISDIRAGSVTLIDNAPPTVTGMARMLKACKSAASDVAHYGRTSMGYTWIQLVDADLEHLESDIDGEFDGEERDAFFTVDRLAIVEAGLIDDDTCASTLLSDLDTEPTRHGLA